MPKLFRAMLADGGKPKVGNASKMLGVRTPPDPHADIFVDEEGNVQPNSGGMSVNAAWRMLPLHLIPKRLRPLVPGACGSNSLICWSIGDGPFDEADLTTELRFRPDPDDPLTHGFVEPKRVMSIGDLQLRLAESRDQWVKDEV